MKRKKMCRPELSSLVQLNGQTGASFTVQPPLVVKKAEPKKIHLLNYPRRSSFVVGILVIYWHFRSFMATTQKKQPITALIMKTPTANGISPRDKQLAQPFSLLAFFLLFSTLQLLACRREGRDRITWEGAYRRRSHWNPRNWSRTITKGTES